MARIRTRSKVNGKRGGDAHEREAEHTARRVSASRPVTEPAMDRSPVAAPQRVFPDLGPGRPLDPEIRARLEPHVGKSLEAVRVHTGSEAADSARSVDARAFTVGRDIVFGAGRYEPGTREGLSLLAHEATHVAQQAAAGTPAVQRAEEPEEDSRKAEEAKAKDAAKALAQSAPAQKLGQHIAQELGKAPTGEKVGMAAGAAPVAAAVLGAVLSQPAAREQLHGEKVPIPLPKRSPVSLTAQPLTKDAPLSLDPGEKFPKPEQQTPTGLGGMLHLNVETDPETKVVKALQKVKKFLFGR